MNRIVRFFKENLRDMTFGVIKRLPNTQKMHQIEDVMRRSGEGTALLEMAQAYDVQIYTQRSGMRGGHYIWYPKPHVLIDTYKVPARKCAQLLAHELRHMTQHIADLIKDERRIIGSIVHDQRLQTPQQIKTALIENLFWHIRTLETDAYVYDSQFHFRHIRKDEGHSDTIAMKRGLNRYERLDLHYMSLMNDVVAHEIARLEEKSSADIKPYAPLPPVDAMADIQKFAALDKMIHEHAMQHDPNARFAVRTQKMANAIFKLVTAPLPMDDEERLDHAAARILRLRERLPQLTEKPAASPAIKAFRHR